MIALVHYIEEKAMIQHRKEVHRLKNKGIITICARIGRGRQEAGPPVSGTGYGGKRGRTIVCLLAAAMLFAAGCSEKETVETQAQAGEAAEQITVLKPEQTSAARAQMEIDEETRQELTAELLEENNMDTSVMEPKRATKGCTFDLPEEFEESGEAAGVYVTGRYPIDASTISYTVMEQDTSLQLMTQETFKEQTQESLSETYDDTVEVMVDSFESMKIDGYPAFRILCHYQVEDIQITQLAYVINADKSYMVIYSQTSDYDRMEEYEASAATIHIK